MDLLLARLEAHRADLPARYRLVVDGVAYCVTPEFVGLAEEPFQGDCVITATTEAIEALVARPGVLTLLRLAGEKAITATPPGLAVTLGQKLAHWT